MRDQEMHLARAAVSRLTADELSAFVGEVWDLAQQRGRTAPAVEVIRDDAGWPLLECPHCHARAEELMDHDIARRATFCTLSYDGVDAPYLWAAYDGHADYEGQLFTCVACRRVVSLPFSLPWHAG